MKPVDQTKFGKPDGNCFAACVATIFELPLEAVPHFMGEWNDQWLSKFRRWCIETLEMEPICCLCNGEEEWLVKITAPIIVSGRGGGELDHATVWVEGKMVHDPHPARAGLKSVMDAIMFIPVRPESYARFAVLERSVREYFGEAGV